MVLLAKSCTVVKKGVSAISEQTIMYSIKKKKKLRHSSHKITHSDVIVLRI